MPSRRLTPGRIDCSLGSHGHLKKIEEQYRTVLGDCRSLVLGQAFSSAPQLLRGYRLCQRPHDVWKDVRLDQLFANFTLFLKRLDERHARPKSPVLPDGKVDTKLVIVKVAGADLIGICAGF